MKRTPLRRYKPIGPVTFQDALACRHLQKIGKRGKRLAAGDAKIRRATKEAGVCAMCGRAGELDDAHILGRDDLTIRHNPLNHLPLDRACHTWAHENPAAFRDWVETLYPGRIEELRRIAREESRTFRREA